MNNLGPGSEMNTFSPRLWSTRAQLRRPNKLCYDTWEELVELTCYFTENVLLD